MKCITANIVLCIFALLIIGVAISEIGLLPFVLIIVGAILLNWAVTESKWL